MTVREEAARLGPHVTYGPGAARRVPEIVGELGARRVLLVCGRRSFEASGAAAMLGDLEARAAVHRFSEFSPNTDVDDVAAGLEVLRAADPDLVLAVGGGSAMDLAKLLGAYADEEDVPGAVRAGGSIDRRGQRLVLVPTTSGSGSEATHFAVVYVGADKHSVAGPAMLPDRVVLDPELSRSGSPHQRASSGIDAVCQAIESRWATGATDESREFARRALALLLDHLTAFVRDATSEAAAGMAVGSHLAGRAINLSKTTAAHALSYALTMRHGVTHGHAVAVTLGPFLEAHAHAGAAELQPGVDASDHRAAMDDILRALDADDGRRARRRFEDLLATIGLERRLTRLGVDSDDERRIVARSVNTERLGNNPVGFDEEGLRRILAQAG